MSFLQVKNNASSILASGIDAVATSLTVASGEGARFPATNFHITIEDEILLCTTRTGDVLTVTRAQEGTAAASHAQGKAVRLNITAEVLDSRTTWTLNKLLKGAGANVAPTEISGWEKISEVIPGSAVDYVDFTGLDINTDKVYILLVNIKNGTAGWINVRLHREGDYTDTNYYTQYLTADGGVISAGRLNEARLLGMPVSDALTAVAFIMRDPDGYMQVNILNLRERASSVVMENRCISSNNTTTNITSLRVSSSATGGIGANSVLMLCRPRSA